MDIYLPGGRETSSNWKTQFEGELSHEHASTMNDRGAGPREIEGTPLSLEEKEVPLDG